MLSDQRTDTIFSEDVYTDENSSGKCYPTISQLFLLVLLFIILRTFIGSPTIFVLIWKTPGEAGVFYSNYRFFFQSAGILVFAGLVYWRAASINKARLRFPFDTPHLLLVLSITVLCFFLNLSIDGVTRLNDSEAGRSLIFGLDFIPQYNIFNWLYILLNIFLEVIIIVGIIMSGMLRKYKPFVAIILPAALFAITWFFPSVIIPDFVTLCICGFLLYKSGHLTYAVIYLGVQHLIRMFYIHLMKEYEIFNFLGATDIKSVGICLIMTAMAFFLTWHLLKNYTKTA